MYGATKRRHRYPAFVKLLETVRVLVNAGYFGRTDGYMKSGLKPSTIGRAGMLVLAASCCHRVRRSAQIPRRRRFQLPRQYLFTAKTRQRAAAAGGPGPGAPLPWTGEDGASGHPLMTASAIREAAANFNNCVAGMWPDAARRDVSQESFQRFTAGLAPDLRIMDLMDSQPEFTKAIWDYLDILVNDNRLAKGREILAKYKPQFDAVEKAYGVDRYIVASIWGIEFELFDHDGRSQRAELHRDAGLHRPPAEILSRTNFWSRWKSCIAAISGPSSCAAPGPAHSGRRSSCRPRSSAMRSMPTATAAATWSTIPMI